MCLLIAGLFAATVTRMVQWHSQQYSRGICIGSGEVHVWAQSPVPRDGSPVHLRPRRYSRMAHLPVSRRSLGTRLNWWPRYQTKTTGPFTMREVRVPLWIPFLLSAGASAWLWWRGRGYPKGRCQKCGYNLTGNVSGVCPECGNPVGQSMWEAPEA